MSEEKKELSVINDLAASHGMEKAAFVAALKATCVPANITDAQFAAFCMVAKQYGLNPITKEIYAFPSKGGGIIPIVSVDGWCNIINSNSQLDGIQFEDKLEDGKLTAITCKIYRKDRKVAVECTEYMKECDRGTEPWKKWPARMLRHKALIQCARYAFSLSGIYDQDEAERMDMVDVTPMVTDPQTGEQVKALPSPFTSKKARKQFSGTIETLINSAETVQELEHALSSNALTIDRMRISDEPDDGYAVAMIDTMADLRRGRLEYIANQEAERLLQLKQEFNMPDGV